MHSEQQRRSFVRRVATGAGVPVVLLLTMGASPAQDLTHPVAVGRPDLGALDYFLVNGSSQLLTEATVGLDGTGGPSRFGAASVVVDLDHDQYFDLVVGAPAGGSQPAAARVDLLFGTATGITAARALQIPSPGSIGDEFGAAIAVGDVNPYDPEAVRTLWIGAPGTTVGGHAKAGAVYRYSLSPTGRPALQDTVTQDSPLVPGAAETGDRFGEVLAATGADVTVGVPHEDIGSARDAGAVWRLRAAAGPDGETPQITPLIAAASWDQSSPGVPGKAEAGDRFGAAVSPDAGTVGVPGEDVGRIKDAGGVQTFVHSGAGNGLVPGPARSQNSPGVPGTAEAGDQFGAALSTGWYTCDETDRTAVGAPGEDLRGQADAGSVTLLTARGCPATVLSQGKGLAGQAETGDRLGSTLATVTGDLEAENNRHDALLIGVPGEDVTAAGPPRLTYKDAGRLMVWGFVATGSGFGPINGDRAGQRYGIYLGTEPN